MGLDLTPQQYLEMLTEEYQEYQEHWQANRYRVSMPTTASTGQGWSAQM
jgi:hypothetical protein